MRVTHALLIAVGLMLPATAALACSMPVGAPIPDCPAGQVFDSASSCACVDANKAPWIKPTPAADEQTKPMDYQAAYAIATQPPADYTACNADADCAVAPGICSKPVAVNSRHEQAYTQASRQANAPVECATTSLADHPAKTAACQQNVCTLK